MNGIKIQKTEEKETEIFYPHVSTLLLILFGIFGILFLLNGCDGISYAKWVIYPVVVILTGVLWITYYFYRQIFYYVKYAVLITTVLYTVLFCKKIHSQLTFFVDKIIKSPNYMSMQMTETVFVFVIFLSIMMFYLEIQIKHHIGFYLFTIMFLIPAPFLCVKVDLKTIFLLALFQGTFWMFRISNDILWKEPVPLLPLKRQYKIADKCNQIAFIFLIVVFGVSLLFATQFSDKLYDVVYMAEGTVRCSLNDFLKRSGFAVTGGKVSRGNNYKTGTEQLQLTVSAKPQEPLYLRGFSGETYESGKWRRSSDEQLYAETIKKYGNQVQFDINSYFSVFYTMNENMISEEPKNSITLKVRHSNGVYNNSYIPYYSNKLDAVEDGYYFQYYEQKDMKIDFNQLSDNFKKENEPCYEFQQEIMEQVRNYGTDFKVQKLPRLIELVEEHPLQNLNDITSFILYTLQENTHYTLTPGWSAWNTDVIEYFLFESKAGYCQHYAAAATLMYQLYGVPARYAAGYRVESSDFQMRDDGNWVASVTDESAHAWVEIYLPEYGWTPVEVTPASDGSIPVFYPGFTNIMYQDIVEENEWEEEESGLSSYRQKSVLQFDLSAWISEFVIYCQNIVERYQIIVIMLGSFLLYSVFLLPLFLDYHRLRKLRKMNAMSSRMIYEKLIHLLHYGGILEDCDGTEEDFAARFAGEVSVISEQEADKLVEAVKKAAYGPPGQQDESDFARKIYGRTVEYIYQKLPRGKKFFFKNSRHYVTGFF